MSDPDLDRARAALARLEHLVVQDIFVTETAQFADVVLPASAWPEKDGTVTNTNRQVQRGRAAVPLPGDARPDWWIIQEIARRFGLDWHYGGPRDVFMEMQRGMPSLANISWERVEREDSVTYPSPAGDASGRDIVFGDRFPTSSGKARFVPTVPLPPDEPWMPKHMVYLDLILVGFGNVGQRFARLLEERSVRLRGDYDLSWRVVGVATKRHGTAYDARGLDVVKALRLAEAGTPLGALIGHESGRTISPEATGLDLIKHATAEAKVRQMQHLVVVETTLLDVARGQPATEHVMAALRGGAHVVTANKGPVAFAYREILSTSEIERRRFLFEGAVMDGIPVFNLVRETLPAVEILGFRGIINTTAHYILTAMETGRSFDEALVLFLCGGAFVGLEKIIEQRIGGKTIGFGADLKTKEERNTGDVLREVQPEDLLRFGLIPEFIGRLPVIATLDELNTEALVDI